MDINIFAKIKHTRKVTKDDNYYVIITIDEKGYKTAHGWIDDEFVKERFLKISKEMGTFNNKHKIIDLLDFGKNFNKGRLFVEKFKC